MEGRAEFINKLNGLVAVAKQQGDQITIDEVKTYFSDTGLTDEQLELVFDYLLAQKIVVKGYLKMTKVEEEITYTDEEKAYLEEYLHDLQAFQVVSDGEKETLFKELLSGNERAKDRLTEIYLREVVELAKMMYHPEIFLGDMIQEGNVGLILGLNMLTDVASAHETIVNQVKQCMQMLIEEHTEVKNRDNKMVEKVTMLDESIQALTEEMGRKVSIDELAVYMGMTEEEIEDILRLMGEESEPEEEQE